MEIKKVFKTIYTELDMYGFTPEQNKALYEYGKMLSKNEELLERAENYYRIIFEKSVYESDVLSLEEKDGLEHGMLFAVIFLARCSVFGEALEREGIPAKYSHHAIWHYKNLFQRNFNYYGYFGFCGMYRKGMIQYILPKTFTFGRLSFEMNTFNGPYVVYRHRLSRELLPVANPDLRYLSNGKQAPKDTEGCFITDFTEGENIEGYTFNNDGTLDFNRISLYAEDYERVLFKGEPVISVHIPGNEKLTKESVGESFIQAKKFFAKYYKDVHFKAFVCSSWLLDTDLNKFLKPESNIIHFQKNFTIVLSFVNTFALYWNIFGIEKFVSYGELVPQNGFQQKILDYVKSGGYLYSGNGFIII